MDTNQHYIPVRVVDIIYHWLLSCGAKPHQRGPTKVSKDRCHESSLMTNNYCESLQQLGLLQNPTQEKQSREIINQNVIMNERDWFTTNIAPWEMQPYQHQALPLISPPPPRAGPSILLLQVPTILHCRPYRSSIPHCGRYGHSWSPSPSK